jgi:uncharacterized protein YigA (DUF484 family)
MTDKLTNKNVAAYLKKHPDFFLDHENLLLQMKLTDNRQGTISLVEKQLAVLRGQQKKTRQQLEDVLTAAKENNEIFDNCRRLILDLMAAKNSETFFSSLEKSLKKDFKCKAYALMIFGAGKDINHFTRRVTKENAAQHIGSLIRAKEPTLGILRPEEQHYLFGPGSEKVNSAAVLAVKNRNRHIALLAIGSSDAHYFSPRMETLFIGFIADSLAKLLPRHLLV